MAEDEIRKHTKTVYKTLMNKEKSWQHKLKEIVVEILIIVFAVTVSIWFHNWSEELKEHKEEKSFLSELKEDLHGDTTNMNSSLRFYEYGLSGIKYFQSVGTGDSLSNDSLRKYGDLLFSTTKLQPHISRYEGLKGSGRFGIIEDKHLLNNIIDFHESDIVRIETLNNYYYQYVQQLSSFVEDNAEMDQPGHITNAEALLRKPRLRFLLIYGGNIIANNIIPAYEEGINKCNNLDKQIDNFLNK
jgi:hypothetical protein